MEQSKLLLEFTTIYDGNLAYHVDDKKENVTTTRENLAKKLKYDPKQLKYMDQIHGNEVKIINKEQNLYKCDAIITNKKNTPLMVMVADCIPILFFDKENNVIAVAHAGRNGVYLNIVTKVIDKMKSNFNCNSKNINIVLGPSIQKCCYEVSQKLANIAINSFGKEFEKNRYIDLQGIVKKQLLENNIPLKNINISKICTKCAGKNYFSYRKNSSCGRFAGVIMMH